MVHSQGFGGHEFSSSSRTQLSQVSHEYTSVDTFEFQIKDQLTPFAHFTNKFLASPKPEANLVIGKNDQNWNKPWKPLTLRAPTIIASLLITVALIAFIEYINKISIEEKALFFAEKAEDFPVGIVFCYRYLPQMIVVASVPNRPVRTPGPWRPIVPSVPGGVGKDGRDGVRLV